MDKDTKARLRKIYNRMAKIAAEKSRLTSEMNDILEDEYGFTHNDFDIDSAIDTLDYGTDNLKFSDFLKLMDEKKKEVCTGDEFYGSFTVARLIIKEQRQL